MSYIMPHFPYGCFVFFLLFATLRTQTLLNVVCSLENGKSGKCVDAQSCPGVMKMIRNGEGLPICGYEGTQTIVCCTPEDTAGGRLVGEMSEKQCQLMYGKSSSRSSWKLRHTVYTAYPAVAGGHDADPAEYPHMAALGYDYGTHVNWGCGGSLISEKYVLTAAHCIYTHFGRVNRIRVGDLDLNSVSDFANPQDRNIARIIAHPDYRPPSVYNDIALIELSENVIINYFVRPACLSTEKNITDDNWNAIGWGSTSFGGAPASYLQTVNLRPFTHEDCRAAYARHSKRKLPHGINLNSHICAGEDSKDTCLGDSGGPLQIRNSLFTSGYKVIGVTAFGEACGVAKAPGVYTRVSHYIEWIESIVWPIKY